MDRVSVAAWVENTLGLGLLLVQGIASLDYGHPTSTLRVAYPHTWYSLAQRRGRVHVSVGLRLRELGAGLGGVHAYLNQQTWAGELWSGVTAWRHQIPAAWLDLP
ncbi:hypothetical protein ACIOMM_35735 [Streptomyces sp. NPDC087908]|uniref:hypothetical protein n=1 Tax=Streptomyces sp. NPDC087908 TaxID=3365820 RepID=UPI00382ECF2B